MKIFSPSNLSFYPIELQADYEASGTWPDDGIEVSDDIFVTCTEARAAGKIISAGTDGIPIVSEPPPPTVEELTRLILMQRDQRMAIATTVIAPFQDAVDLGIATDEEKAALTRWKQYRVDLNRIEEQNDFPQTINWPQAPA